MKTSAKKKPQIKRSAAKKPPSKAFKAAKKGRSKLNRRVATGVVAASAVGIAAAGIAIAASRTERPIPKLPAPGSTIEMDLISKGIELVFVGHKVNTGPLKGNVTFEVSANPGDPSSVQTKVNEFFLTSPAKQGGITIAVEPNKRNNGDQSVLRHSRSQSPTFEHTLNLPLKITVRYPEVLGLPADTEEPLSLSVQAPAVLVGKLSGFPDKGARYRLKETIALALPGQPNTDVATIVKFPVRVEGL
jgi:hypothetical protein